ncbi:ABC-type oligopeptide transport system, periplasmic component [Secundilactobacillus oryzae JCM 18671]|uniref:ABC-type oligopeptide transport system, periplasmic component n=1 Tax=Secundilactobacillus oryzae JCM 18671 TaxID=1291743 RepID=A0A081BIG4_9LACO|nr:peptide ABC transporter substrate-binding protein [Secundilactobacillus oryzae]GAK47832.1 ABC-type oligopeptide transport system, periplasmic component [Secundilactobacillus oryzae JCM 18671]
MKTKYLVFGTTALAGMLLVACGNESGASVNKSKPLSVTLASEPLTADPNKATDTNSASLIYQTMEGLYTFDKKNNLVPGVAEKVVKPTNGGKTYTFTLRKDAKWANGQQVTAQDFVTSFRRTVDPKTKAQYASNYSAFKNYDAIQNGKKSPNALGVKALSKTKLQVQLSNPVPYFNYLAASKYLPLNTDAVHKYGQKYGTNADKTMANGPYKLVGWTGSNSTWKYIKNTKYWNAKNVKVKKVNVQVTKDQNTAVNLFKSDKVQETTVNGQYVRQNSNNKQLQTHLIGRLQYLYFNNKKSVSNSENLRQAMSYVVNRKTLTENVLQDGSKPAKSFVPVGDQKNPETGKDMATETGNLLPTDVKKAQSYWKAYLKEKGKSSITLNLLTDDTDEDKHVGTYIQATAQKYFKGLKVTITSIPHAQHVSRDFDGSFEMNLTGWSTNWLDAYDFLDLAASDNTVNFTQWKDAAFDKLLEQSETQTGQTRYDTLAKANKRLMDVKGVVPLYQPSEAKLVSKNVGGLDYSLLNEAQYQYAYWK